MNRPRTFCWVSRNGVPFPQVIFDDPRVGCENLRALAERRLQPSEFELSLDQLAAKYPPPSLMVSS